MCVLTLDRPMTDHITKIWSLLLLCVCYNCLSILLHVQCLAFRMHNHIWFTKQSRKIKWLSSPYRWRQWGSERLSDLAVVPCSQSAVEWGLNRGCLAPEPRPFLLTCLCCLPPPRSLCWRPSQSHRSCRQLDYVNCSIPSNNYSWLFEDSYLQIYLLTKIYTPKPILQTIPPPLLDPCIELLAVPALSWPGTRWSSVPSFQLSSVTRCPSHI